MSKLFEIKIIFKFRIYHRVSGQIGGIMVYLLTIQKVSIFFYCSEVTLLKLHIILSTELQL